MLTDSSHGSRLIYALVIFASAFLLFEVEPILGKILTPWFGGAATVWIVCLSFFQVLLLLGYSYAHLLTRRAAPRSQARIHVGLLAVSLVSLPILPKDAWRPSAPNHPAFHILLLLAATAGLPYFLLSSTSPLLQAWYARGNAGAAPYRFYALSNAGSMLALISYPILLEPWVGTSHQARGWSWAYAAFATICALLALSAGSPGPPQERAASTPPPGWRLQVLWMSLAACGSALLLAITHHITQNVASVPLLWVVPLALYLLTFILCFDGRGWYRQDLFLRLLGVALGSLAYALAPSFSGLPIKLSVPLFCGCLFVCCMFCHGELARLKPPPDHLTQFYLMCSLGGAVGALFVALIAPQVFNGDYELRIAIVGCVVLALFVLHRDHGSPFHRALWQPAWLLTLALALTIIVSLGITAREEAGDARVMVRNFYGVLRVVDQTAPKSSRATAGISPAADQDSRFAKLMNGTIDHGLQFLAPARRRETTTYYGPPSGIGITMSAAEASPTLKVGMIGLGVGTLAAYGKQGDAFTFYEINPLVVQIANRDFSFLRDSKARVNVVMGDGRVSLEQEQPQGFDVLVVDAFSGDAIPVHLLTREAFALYFRHLKPQGTLAVHVSNQYLDLAPVVNGAATWFHKEVVMVTNRRDEPREIYQSTWILVGSHAGFWGKSEVEKVGTVLAPSTEVQWTDDYSGLFTLLRF